jgi:hypothetical protein
MQLSALTPKVRRRIHLTVPAILNWDTYARSLANLLLFALAAAGGEWLVHQAEYAIVYGPRFSTVMSTTPHRFYMGPVGVALALLAQGLLLVFLAALAAAAIRRSRLLSLLPPRVQRRLPPWSWQLPASRIVRTAIALAIFQINLYIVQENVETAAVGAGWPGLSIVLGSIHATVIPLDLVTALAISIVLWASTTWRSRSERAVELARLLSVLWRPRSPGRSVTISFSVRLPDLRFIAGGRGLRSPPFPA